MALHKLDPENSAGIASNVGSVILKQASEDAWRSLAAMDAGVAAWLFAFQPTYFLQGIRVWSEPGQIAVLRALVASLADATPLVEPILRDDARDLLKLLIAASQGLKNRTAPSALSTARKIAFGILDGPRAASILPLLGHAAFASDEEIVKSGNALAESLKTGDPSLVPQVLRAAADPSMRTAVEVVEATFPDAVDLALGRAPSDDAFLAAIELGVKFPVQVRPVVRQAMGLWLSDPRSNLPLILEATIPFGMDDDEMQRVLIGSVSTRVAAGYPVENARGEVDRMLKAFRNRHGMRAYGELKEAIRGAKP
jgi:hypothetical protein